MVDENGDHMDQNLIEVQESGLKLNFYCKVCKKMLKIKEVGFGNLIEHIKTDIHTTNFKNYSPNKEYPSIIRKQKNITDHWEISVLLTQNEQIKSLVVPQSRLESFVFDLLLKLQNASDEIQEEFMNISSNLFKKPKGRRYTIQSKVLGSKIKRSGGVKL